MKLFSAFQSCLMSSYSLCLCLIFMLLKSKVTSLHVKKDEDDDDEGLKSSTDSIVYITRAGGHAFLCPGVSGDPLLWQ